VNPPLLGIMQGRLSSPTGGRIQAFPHATWREEFQKARAAALFAIEWIYEQETEEENPLGTDAGVAEIKSLAAASGVQVRSVCADYFMTRRLVGEDGTPDAAALARLRWLLERAAALGVAHVVLPFVDASSLRTPREHEGAVAALSTVAAEAARRAVELHLETDLAPLEFAALLARLGDPVFRVNFDIGNSASLGYEPKDELRAIGPFVGSVHVKDRVLGGGTVPLGTGAADFAACFRGLHGLGYRGLLTLQAARVPGVDEVELAARNRRFVLEAMACAGVKT
jgi:hexulose-6-phosphate isomerase